MSQARLTSRTPIRFRRDERGSATVEFVVLFPIVMSIFLMGLEAGYYLLRDVMLDRATALAARNIGLGKGDLTSYADVRDEICDAALILPDCAQRLQVEMWVVDVTPGGPPISDVARCVDLSSSQTAESYANFRAGASNQLVALRTCALSEPMFPTTAFASSMAVDNRGNYALVSKVGFVMEPADGTIGSPSGSTGSNDKPTDPCANGACTGGGGGPDTTTVPTLVEQG